jgi:Pentapeptide repeats (8 copies)
MPDPSDSNAPEFAPPDNAASLSPDAQDTFLHAFNLPSAGVADSSLKDDLEKIPPFEAVELDPALTERIRQGDSSALHQGLNLKIAAYQAKAAEVVWRGDRLQLSVSGLEVPDRSILEPLLQRWIVQLALPNVSAVELYGQRDGSDLPFWRSTFNPLEIDLDRPPDGFEMDFFSPSAFVDPLQVEFNGESPPNLPEEPPILSEDPILDPFIEVASLDALPEAPTIDYWTEAPEPEAFAGKEEAEKAPVQSSSPPVQSSPPAQSSPRAQTNPWTTAKTSEAATSAEKIKAVADFLARYAAGEREFANINLSEANLSGVNLTLADLHNAEFVWTNFKEASLYHVNLSGAKLRYADLSGAKLRSSNLQGTDFLNANLSGADLSWSNLNGANLTGADLTDANLSNAILERVILPDGTLLD